jgi:hypothetical protein
MNSLTMDIHHQIGKGGNIPILTGRHHPALPTAPAFEDGSFAGILYEKKEFARQDNALPINPERGRLQGESFVAGTPRKVALTRENMQSAQSIDQDNPERSIFDSAAPEMIEESASSVSGQSVATLSLNRASPESHATVAHGKGWGFMAHGFSIKPGSAEFHILKGGYGFDDGPGLDGEMEKPAETQGLINSLRKQISPAADRPFSEARKNEPAAVMTQNIIQTHPPDAVVRKPALASLDAEGLSDRNVSCREVMPVALEQASAQRPAARHGRQSERSPMDSAVANLKPTQDESFPEGMMSRVFRTAVFTRNEPAAVPFKESSAVSGRPDRHSAAGRIEQKGGRIAAEQAEMKGALPEERVIAVKEISATGEITERDESRASGVMRIDHSMDRNAWPLRAGWIGQIHSAEAKTPPSGALPAHCTQAIIDQLMDARQTMNNDFGRVRIMLSPPNLGNVDLQIVMRRERVEVLMTTDHSGVQQSLLSRADDIRIALERHDLKIVSFQILLDDHTANQRQTHGGSMFEQRQDHQDKHDVKDSECNQSAAVPGSVIEASKSASGQVSIFI